MEIAEAAEIASEAAQAAGSAGQPLAAASADLARPDAPHLRLSQAATVRREHRGAADRETGPHARTSYRSPRSERLRSICASRGWSDEAWSAVRDRLVERGWMPAEGRATPRGTGGCEHMERLTDERAAGPWRDLETEGTRRLAQLVVSITKILVGTGLLPRPSTPGMQEAAS